MIDTPNQGSVLASVSGAPGAGQCILADTANLRDLQPTSSFLQGPESAVVAHRHPGALDRLQ